MKKIISLVCVLALMLTMSTTAFAADTSVRAALGEKIQIANNVYYLSDTSLGTIDQYLSDNGISPTDSGIITAVKNAKDTIKNAVANGTTDLAALLTLAETGTTGMLSALKAKSYVFSIGGLTLQITGQNNKIYPITISKTPIQTPTPPSNNPGSNGTGSSTPAQNPGTVDTVTGATGTTTVSVTPSVDVSPVVTGNTASLVAAVPSSTADVIATATPQNPAAIRITAPVDAIVNQLNTGTATSVALTLAVPPQVIHNTNANVSVALNLGQAILKAAVQTKKDVTISVVDSTSNLEIYSWTFKGAELAKSANELKDINLALGLSNTAANSSVGRAISSANKGLLLGFANNGDLPAPASLRIFAVDRFPGLQTLYLYYYNEVSNQLETVDHPVCSVDSAGYANIVIDHNSQYVLLSQQVAAVKPVKVDTGRSLKIKVGKTYQFKVTASAKPTFVSANNSVFKVVANGVKGNDYFFLATAVGKVGQGAGFYLNKEKSPRTIGTIVK